MVSIVFLNKISSLFYFKKETVQSRSLAQVIRGNLRLDNSLVSTSSRYFKC